MKTFNEEIFAVLRGYGYILSMYDAAGKGPIANPDLAAYIQAKDIKSPDDNIMIRMPKGEESSEYPKVIVYKSESNSPKFEKLLASIKRLALSSGFTVTYRVFGKSIEPKDVGFQVKAEQETEEARLSESKYETYGSTRSSYHENPKGKSRVIIRHSKQVDETKMGARSRSVKTLFVESKDGERRIIPSKSLRCARALSNYANNGGNIYDESANRIVQLADDAKAVKKLKKAYPLVENDDDNTRMHKAINEVYEGLTHLLERLGSNKINEYLSVLEVNQPNYVFAETFYKTKLGEAHNDYVGSLARGSIINSKSRKI